MQRSPKDYTSFAEFERQELRPEMRIGWTTDELEHTGKDLDFDLDPFEAALWAAEQEEDE